MQSGWAHSRSSAFQIAYLVLDAIEFREPAGNRLTHVCRPGAGLSGYVHDLAVAAWKKSAARSRLAVSHTTIMLAGDVNGGARPVPDMLIASVVPYFSGRRVCLFP